MTRSAMKGSPACLATCAMAALSMSTAAARDSRQAAALASGLASGRSLVRSLPPHAIQEAGSAARSR